MTQVVSPDTWRTRLKQVLREESLRLPVMPDIVARVQQEAARRSASAQSLARVVEVEPGLAARVIKLANSAMFAGLSEIRDLTHAVGRLGAGMVVALVVGAASRECFRAADPSYAKRAHDAWEASLIAAAAARALAHRAALAPEEAFLSGLLHRVGEPILLQAVQAIAGREGQPLPPVAEIWPAVDALAAEAGATLLERWNVPETIVQSVRHQTDVESAPSAAASAAALVGIAREIGARLACGRPVEEAAEGIAGSAAAAVLGAGAEELSAVAGAALEGARELSRIL